MCGGNKMTIKVKLDLYEKGLELLQLRSVGKYLEKFTDFTRITKMQRKLKELPNKDMYGHFVSNKQRNVQEAKQLHEELWNKYVGIQVLENFIASLPSVPTHGNQRQQTPSEEMKHILTCDIWGIVGECLVEEKIISTVEDLILQENNNVDNLR